MTDETSTSASATPATGAPVTGTPASSGVTPPKPSTTLEEALAKIAELEHANKNATEERDRHRKKLTAYEQSEEAAKLAAMGDLEKAQAQAKQLEQQIQQLQDENVKAQIQLQAKNLGIVNAELIAPYVLTKLEKDADGKPTNLDKVLDEIIKANPNIRSDADSAAQTANATRPPTTPANNPGRSSIVQPGTLPPNKVTTFHDIYTKR